MKFRTACIFVDGENLRHSLGNLFSTDFDRADYLPKQAKWVDFFDHLVSCVDAEFRMRTTPEETRCFRLLDRSRSRYRRLLAEMFLNEDDTHYFLCFRPLGVTKDSPNRRACRYPEIPIKEIRAAGRKRMLTDSIAETLREPATD
jgi:hypothetical protein